MKRLSEKLSEANLAFKELDSKINEVSGKIIHLGDQLERKNAPRHSLKEARDLILEFSKFLGAGGGTFANVSVKSQADETQVRLALLIPTHFAKEHEYALGQLNLTTSIIDHYTFDYSKRDNKPIKTFPFQY